MKKTKPDFENHSLCLRCESLCCKFAIYLSEEDIERLEQAGKKNFKEVFCIPVTEGEMLDSILTKLGKLADIIPENVKRTFRGETHKSLVKLREKPSPWSLKKRKDGLCMFWGKRENGTGYCTVYEHRPYVCRIYRTDQCVDFRKLIIKEEPSDGN